MENKINRLTDYMRINEQNVRAIHQMVHDMKEELSDLKVQANRMEITIKKIEQHFDL